MKKILLAIVLVALSFSVAAQEDIFNAALKQYRKENETYQALNAKKKDISIREVMEYAKWKRYIVLNYQSATIIKFGDFRDVVYKVDFLTNSDECDRYVFNRYFNENKKLGELKTKGYVWFLFAYPNIKSEKIQVKWSGPVREGWIDGSGVGYYRRGDEIYYLSGNFNKGLLTDDATFGVGYYDALLHDAFVEPALRPNEKNKMSKYKVCCKGYSEDMACVLNDKTYSFLNRNGELVGSYNKVESLYKNGVATVVNTKNIEMIVDKGGRLVDYTARQKKNVTGNTVTFTVNGAVFKMIKVEGGTFTMGCTNEQGGDCNDDESPAHRVTLSDYYMGETEVTQELWQAVMGRNPSYFKGGSLPVEQVSWYDCQDFIRKLNQLTGEKFRLPTEAEWEYAARGGNKSRGYKYAGGNDIGSVGWYRDNSRITHSVKTKQPNELGLYDMSGNVWEWCSDWYDKNYYGNSPQNNPQGPASGSVRVRRGGSWRNCAISCRGAKRNRSTPGIRFDFVGFRLVSPK